MYVCKKYELKNGFKSTRSSSGKYDISDCKMRTTVIQSLVLISFLKMSILQTGQHAIFPFTAGGLVNKSIGQLVNCSAGEQVR